MKKSLYRIGMAVMLLMAAVPTYANTRLFLEEQPMDTIDTIAILCPGERLVWHNVTATQTGVYGAEDTNEQGETLYYRATVTVMELIEKTIRLALCGSYAVEFKGKTYDTEGHYYDKGTCDSLYHIIVYREPSMTYTTNAVFDGVHPYNWHFWDQGEYKDSLFYEPGTYEFISPNPETGCDDTWRLLLRLDANTYHFVEQVTLCEGEPYSWRGHDNISQVPGVSTYLEELKTRTGFDSIYELRATVLPVSRTNRTINFCGTITWKDSVYEQTATVYDTLTAANGCDSIIKVSLRHVDPFYRLDTATIVQGERLIWHDKVITTDGIYFDQWQNEYGCDSTYELHVGIEPVTPQTNMITTMATICEGDYYEWRGHKYYNEGNFVDTVPAASEEEQETIYALKLTVTPISRRHEKYTFCEGETLGSIYGVNYTNKVMPGEVYRDTVTAPNDAHPSCPDTVYLEIYQYPVIRTTEVAVLHPGETITWHGQTIQRAGTYLDEHPDEGLGGCGTIDYLRVVQDMRDSAFICRIDTAEDTHPDKKFPYVWREDTLYTTGLWTDTVWDEEGLMKEFHSLDLHVLTPFDTTVYVHGCVNAYWHDEVYDHDTVFVDRIEVDPEDPMQPCDSVFHVHVIIGKEYYNYIDTTLCEYELPLLLGRQDQDTIWAEGTYQHRDFTAWGCDSVISVNLHIIPKLFKNDSTFLCENEIKEHPVWLGDTVTPWFEYRENGRFAGTWQGKWHGVKYTEDTIVWDCNHEYFHHIIVRPSQKVVEEKTIYLCPGDTLQLFWPYDTTWFYKDTTYEELRPMTSSWTDSKHGYTYADDSHACDSMTIWHIKRLVEPLQETKMHRLLGDSVWWGGDWRYYTGSYDSIALSKDTNSFGDTCTYIYRLHLTMDTAYYFRDTVSLCSVKEKTWTHVWPETGYEQKFTVGTQDTSVHYIDSLITYDRRDSIYDLYVHFSEIPVTVINAHICLGDSMPFGLTRAHLPRYLKKSGVYRDTLVNYRNGCDSILELHLNTFTPHINAYTVHIADTLMPYVWKHEQGGEIIATDTLRAAGEYTYRFVNSHDCDSIDSLSLRVHKTYLFRDTVTICSSETPYAWENIQDIYTSDTYTVHLQTHDGYDSTLVRYVEVLPVKKTTYHHTICEKSEYTFHDQVLTEQGTYIDTLQAKNGCDSIVTLILSVEPLRKQTDYSTILDGDSVIFYGKWIKESGIYEHSELNSLGCDNLHQLIVKVIKQSFVDTTAYVCENNLPFVWRGVSYYEEGDYAVPTAWTDSSRVVTTLHLHFKSIDRETRIVDLCKGSTFVYKGIEHTENEIFADTIPNLSGCDSIIEYIIRVHPTLDRRDTVHISDKQTYEFNGRTLTKEGDYVFSDTTIYGCDSLHHLHLVVHPSYFFTEKMNLCKPDTIDWHGKQIYDSGIYTDSLLTYKYGFDSVYQLVVEAHESYYINETHKIGNGEVIVIHNRDITEPGEYFDTLRTAFGCDSIFHIVVNPKGTREYKWYETICKGDYYDFFGRKLTRDGTYTYTSPYSDSIVTLTLTVNPVSVAEKRILISDKRNYYTYDGKLYEDLHIGDNLFVDTLLNAYGCDSINRLIISVTTHYSDWDPIPLCPGGEVKIDADVITEPGLYTFERRSKVTGEMDSLYRVEVYAAPAYDLPTEEVIMCEGDTIYYSGKMITRGGHYDFRLKTKEGCDSLLHLDVTMNPSYHFYIDTTIADYGKCVWYGKTYTETGVHERSWPTVNDCDSTYTLRLTVIETQRFLTEDTICEGDSYSWRGKNYDIGGYYADTIFRPETFYSAIYTLQLTTLRPTLITGATVADVCADAERLDIEFTYSGSQPEMYSIYFDQLAKNEGFRDVINEPFFGDERVAHAPIPKKTDVVYLEHTTYVKPNRYSLRLVLDNGVCGFSRSDSLMMTVKYPNWIIEQNWDNIVAPLRKELNGGYEFIQTNWYINGALQPNDGLGYLHSDKLHYGDEVVMEATRKGDSYPIQTCPLVITLPKPNVLENPIIVYPTQAPRHMPIITIQAPQGGQYMIFSATGSLIGEGKMGEGSTSVTLPNASGMYFIRTTQNEQMQTHKVLIY